jgi:predicted RNA-binding Zn-ribbon protein involved in translation (DUF1610 family)
MFAKRMPLSREMLLLLILVLVLPGWYLVWQRGQAASQPATGPVSFQRCTACGHQVQAEADVVATGKCPECGRAGTLVLVIPPSAGQPLELFDFLLRIGVGIASFLAVVTLLWQRTRGSKAKKALAAKHWVPCAGCGNVVRAKADRWKFVCPECGEDLNLSTPETIAVPGEQQEVSDYMKALVKDRQKRKRL